MKIKITKSQFETLLFEMAKPSEAMNKNMWFHGTNEDNGKKILESGYLKPSISVTKRTRAAMAPIFNKTYLTANLDEAVRYAMFRSEVGETPYLIGISGENLLDVQPDEDIIADLLQTDETIKGFEWLVNLAKLVDAKLHNKFKKEGDYAHSVRLAKKIVNQLSDERKIELINKGMKLAHSGEIPITNVWMIPPLESRFDSAIGKDISYYIDNMYKIK